MLRLRNRDVILEKVCKQLFLMRWESGQCAVHFAIQSREGKNNALLLYKGIVEHNWYETIDSLSQT